MMLKRCSRCSRNLEVVVFGKDKSTKDGLSHWCKECRRQSGSRYRKTNGDKKRERDRKYYSKNKKAISKYYKKYREKNKERLSEYKKKWYKENTESVKERVKNNHTKRLKTDTNYKLAFYLRCRLCSAIRKNQKSGSFVRDLGCSISELKIYLENKFDVGMAWDNHGDWHIDHIIPLASFDLTDREQFLKACHYTNLQPLWAKDNIKKGAKLDWEG